MRATATISVSVNLSASSEWAEAIYLYCGRTDEINQPRDMIRLVSLRDHLVDRLKNPWLIRACGINL